MALKDISTVFSSYSSSFEIASSSYLLSSSPSMTIGTCKLRFGHLRRSPNLMLQRKQSPFPRRSRYSASVILLKCVDLSGASSRSLFPSFELFDYSITLRGALLLFHHKGPADPWLRLMLATCEGYVPTIAVGSNLAFGLVHGFGLPITSCRSPLFGPTSIVSFTSLIHDRFLSPLLGQCHDLAKGLWPIDLNATHISSIGPLTKTPH